MPPRRKEPQSWRSYQSGTHRLPHASRGDSGTKVTIQHHIPRNEMLNPAILLDQVFTLNGGEP